MAEQQDIWAAGNAYEPYIGRWSRLVASRFLSWLALPPDKDWLDIGCGTGAVTRAILTECAPRRVVGVDSSPGFLAYASAHITDPRVTFAEGGAEALPLDDAAIDVAVSGLVLNFVADPARAIDEMRRVLRPGGDLAVYVWDYAGEAQLIRRFWDAATAIDPSAAALDEGVRFPLCKPERLTALYAAAGLADIACAAIDVPTVFKSFDDLWQPFLGGQGPAPGYCMALPGAQRARLCDQLRRSLPVEDDGSIRLLARAWAIRGTRP